MNVMLFHEGMGVGDDLLQNCDNTLPPGALGNIGKAIKISQSG